jgi:hypothetical protein
MNVYLAQSSNEMHINPDVFGLSNTKPYVGMQSCIVNDDVASLPPHILMMWLAHHLGTEPDSTVWPHHTCSV